MRIISLLLFLGLSYLSFAQNISINWQKQYGGSFNDRLTAITLLSDQSAYIAVGYSNSNDFDVPTNQGNEDIWVLSINIMGDTLWTRAFGGSQNERATAVVPTTDGGILVLAYTESSDGLIPMGYGGKDLLVLKLSQEGTLHWIKNYGGTEDEEAFSIVALPQQQYAVTGYTRSNNQDISAHRGAKDIWLFTITEQGDLIWSATYGGTKSEEAKCMIYDEQQQQLVLGGFTASEDGDVARHQYGGSKDCWILRLSLTGELLSEQTYGGSGSEVITDMLLTNEKQLVFVGETSSEDGDISAILGGVGSDIWVVQLRQDGRIQWDVNVGTKNFDTPYGVQQDQDGHLVVLGQVLGQLGDAYVAKLGYNNGQILQERLIAGANDDIPLQLLATTNQQFLLVGHTDSPPESIGKIKARHGAHEGWIMNISFPIMTGGLPETEIPPILVYPNPTQQRLFINGIKPFHHIKYKLYDERGNVKYRQVLTNSKTAINLPILPNGIYFYAITHKNKAIKQGKLLIYK